MKSIYVLIMNCSCDNYDNHMSIILDLPTNTNKMLRQYFMMINNSCRNPCDYCKNLFKLDFNKINEYANELTTDEKIVVEVLYHNLDNITIRELTRDWNDAVDGWSQEDMYEFGLEQGWTYDTMIGQLWELHRGYIDG